MPTATAFAWEFPWNEFVGVWNAIMTMFNGPIAILAAIGLAITLAGFVVYMFIKRKA